MENYYMNQGICMALGKALEHDTNNIWVVKLINNDISDESLSYLIDGISWNCHINRL